MDKCQRTYNNMKYRCNNPKASKFFNYGGKGIKCNITLLQLRELWLRDNADSMKQPSIDRIDPLDNYTPQNCRFIEMDQNRKERRKIMPGLRVRCNIGMSLNEEELKKLKEIQKNNPKITYKIIFLKGIEALNK